MNKFEEMTDANRADVEGPASSDERSETRRERRYTIIVLLAIALFTLGDLIEDRFDGAPWSHVLSELGIVVIATGLAYHLFQRSRAPLIEKGRLLERELVRARGDAKKWQNEAAGLLEGLSLAISEQLDDWKLSQAEKEIALLLLKGLSHKEIAVVRETNEQTVRQQAASIYHKSGISGRTELSAFFLEDLLVPAKLTKQRES